MPHLPCLKSGNSSDPKKPDAKKPDAPNPKPVTRVLPEQEMANHILLIMLRSSSTASLRRKATAQLPDGGWNETVAHHLFDSLVRQLNAGAGVVLEMDKAMQKAHDVAKAGKIGYEYPNLISAGTSVTALGMLTIVMPEAVAALGFEETEPAADSFATIWQRTYSNIPYRVFYRYLHALESGGKWRGETQSGREDSYIGVAK
ncbi:hypothetical protein E2P81_ATG05578 [Venturia nashicola]|uniref:Uncharacterized protein n=1 Tax=Venturia nashicola TaxID=86259 RepID=A0A4Z1P144_9PEZI|nr:hypothetical protein E6O75_ATG05713 [Venturia nashicola]TLD32602.1 hypothetical protein E2P81_ATG05578 [Venturia nashicola]